MKQLETDGVDGIAFSPLAQGLLSDRYLNGIPEGSRASKPTGFLKAAEVDEAHVSKARAP
jgi:L-glyceraldehyde 3-phosphate reductase